LYSRNDRLLASGSYAQKYRESVPADRESILPWIAEYSPYALVSAGDPPETEFVNVDVTVSERIEEIEQFHALVRSFTLMSSDALTLPPDDKQFFFEKVKEEGELSALKWLNGREYP